MMPPTLNSEMTLTLMPCNTCKGAGLVIRKSTMGVDICPQCEGSGCLVEILFMPEIFLPQHGWVIRGAIARIDLKGDKPFGP